MKVYSRVRSDSGLENEFDDVTDEWFSSESQPDRANYVVLADLDGDTKADLWVTQWPGNDRIFENRGDYLTIQGPGLNPIDRNRMHSANIPAGTPVTYELEAYSRTGNGDNLSVYLDSSEVPPGAQWDSGQGTLTWNDPQSGTYSMQFRTEGDSGGAPGYRLFLTIYVS